MGASQYRGLRRRSRQCHPVRRERGGLDGLLSDGVAGVAGAVPAGHHAERRMPGAVVPGQRARRRPVGADVRRSAGVRRAGSGRVPESLAGVAAVAGAVAEGGHQRAGVVGAGAYGCDRAGKPGGRAARRAVYPGPGAGRHQSGRGPAVRQRGQDDGSVSEGDDLDVWRRGSAGAGPLSGRRGRTRLRHRHELHRPEVRLSVTGPAAGVVGPCAGLGL